MSGSYLSNKKSIYNYRAKNVDKYNEYMKNTMKRKYDWKKIQKEFLNILIVNFVETRNL
jgi:hypothetical protein